MVFTSKTFHLWPFGKHGHGFFSWRGFIEKNEITVTSSDFIINWGKGQKTFPTKELEFCIKKHRYFGLGNSKIHVGLVTEEDKPVDWKFIWTWVTRDFFYLPKKKVTALEDALKTESAVCFDPNSRTVYSKAPWYRIDMLLSGNRSSMWLNPKHLFTSEDVTKWYWHALDIDKIKYVYTKGWIVSDLYVGAEDSLRLKHVSLEDGKTIKGYLMTYGANFAADADIEYHDSWTPEVIFSPSLWFTHSSIGFTNNGLVYKQKTFKTNDNIFLPWDKINMATAESHWKWLFTKDICIYGEQNILPRKRYSKRAVNAIIKTIEEKGVHSFEGVTFKPSYHTSWFGILMCWATLSIYHWIIVALYNIIAKRETLAIGDKKMIWNGKLFYYTTDKKADWYKIPSEEKRLTSLVANVSKDVWDVWYVKKKWYHLWGYEIVRVHPYNIRMLDGMFDGSYVNQCSVHYVFVQKKIWCWNAKAIKTEFIKEGYRFEAVDKEHHKEFKKWAKWYVNEYY